MKKISIKKLQEDFVWACNRNKLDTVKYCLTSPELTHYPDIQYNNNQGLREACNNGHLDIVKYLTSAPELLKPNSKGIIIGHADIKARNYTPVLEACFNGHLDLIKYFWSHPDLVLTDAFKPYIIHACRSGNIDLVDWLLHHQNKLHFSVSLEALYAAVSSNHNNVADYLFSLPDNNLSHQLAYEHACVWGLLPMVQHFAPHSDVYANDSIGFINAYKHGNIDVLKYLLCEQHADIHANNDGAIIYCCSKGLLENVKFLLAAPELLIPDSNGVVVGYANIHAQEDAAFKGACEGRHADIISYLAFDYKMTMTPDILNYLQQQSSNFFGETKELCEKILLNGNLQQILPINNNGKNKMKL